MLRLIRVPLVLITLLCVALACSESPEVKKAKHLEKGDQYFSEQKYKEAIIEYRNVIQLDGSNARAFERTGMAFLELHDPVKAFQFLSKARDLNPDNLELRLKVGTLYLLGQKRSEAREEVNYVLQKDPKNFGALTLLADLAQTPDEISEALDTLKEAEAEFKNEPRYHIAIGALYLKKRDISKAENAFMDALSGKSNSVEAHLALADLALMKRDLNQAEQEYKAAADLAPGASQAQMRLADFYVGMMKVDEARKILSDVVAKSPDFTAAVCRLADLDLDDNHLDEAQKLIDTLTAKNPEAPETLVLKGRLSLLRNQTADALKYLDAVAKARPELPQAHYLLGVAQLRSGNVEEAKAQFRQAVNLNPDYTEAVVRLSALHVRDGSFRAAWDDLLRILTRTPRNLEALVLLADAAVSPQEVNEALRRLRDRDLEFKDVPQYHLALSVVYVKQGKTKEAESEVNLALALDPKLPDAHLAMASLAVFRNDPARAEEEYRAAIALAPDNANVKMNLVNFYLRENKVQGAREVLDDIVVKNPESLAARVRLASLDFNDGRYDDALKQLEPVFAANASDPAALDIRARVALANGKTADAQRDLQILIKEQPNSAPALFMLGICSIQLNDTNQAKTYLQSALKLDPGFTEAGVRLGEILMREGANKEVIELVGRVFSEKPKTADALFLLGSAQLAIREPGRAMESARALVQLNASDPRGPYLTGVALRDLGKPDEARPYLVQAVDMAPTSFRFLSDLVAMDLADKKMDAALARVKRAVDRTPDSAALHFLLGKVHAQGNQLTEAEAEYLKSTELDPGQVDSYVALTRLYSAANNPDRALAKLEDGLRANPDSVALLMLQGMILQQRGNIPRAQEAYEKILTVDPGFALAANNLACLFSENLGDQEKALRLAQTAREKAPNDPQVADTLGWILYKKGNFDWALSYLKESATRLADSPEVQYHLGMTFYRLGDAPAAKKTLTRALELNSNFAGAEEARKALAEL